MSGTITNIFIKSAVGGAMQPVNLAQALANKGLEGDANIGKRRRQVLLIEHETITEWGLAPGTVRENVTVRNLALAGLPEGTHLQVGSAVLEVTGDCAPCEFMDQLAAGLRAKVPAGAAHSAGLSPVAPSQLANLWGWPLQWRPPAKYGRNYSAGKRHA